tara:strand:- start:17 stop:901 length:885 start_codon:yes stop_codon:yes gene_type:complete
MTYIPKSKLQKLQASINDNFINPLSGESYVGPYVKLSNNSTYAGNGSTLQYKIERRSTPQTPNINRDRNSSIYSVLKSGIEDFLNNVTDIISSKSLPSEDDYKRGYFTRYFASRNNSPHTYIEVNQETHRNILTSSPKHDFHLYTADSIIWALTGNVFKINPLTIKNKSKKYPFIDNFFILINEFHRPEKENQENLHTNGKELYNLYGEEYIGSYHIHPTKGPMEGPKHTESNHNKLYYVDTLPVFSNNETDPYRNFLDSQEKDTTPTNNDSVNVYNNISSPENLSSGGGGGGY